MARSHQGGGRGVMPTAKYLCELSFAGELSFAVKYLCEDMPTAYGHISTPQGVARMPIAE